MKDNKHTNYYVTSIIQDIQTRFVEEKTTKFSLNQIERTYEFDDGAVVVYEWRDASVKQPGDAFNHRFTLQKPPKPNPHKLAKGVIKVIDFHAVGR
jgi:hypothetical protein